MAVVVQTDEGQPALALGVDDVVSVVELAADAVQPPPLAAPEGNGALPLLSGLVDLPGVQTQSLVQILAADRLLAMLHAPSRAGVAASAASPKPEVEDAVAD